MNLKLGQSQIGFYVHVKKSKTLMQYSPRTRDVQYLQTYFQLKGQRTVLTKLAEILEGEMSKQIPEIKEESKKIDDEIKKLLSSTYIDLVNSLDDITMEISKHVRTMLTIDQESAATANKILTAIMSFNKLTKTFTLEETAENYKETLSEETSKPQYDPETDSTKIVCRICGEPIDIDLIDQHTKSCIDAFHSASKIHEIDTKLEDLQNSFDNSPLAQKWPGEQTEALKTLLPLLNIYLLLLRTREIEYESADAGNELSQIANLAKSLNANELCILALEKRRSCSAFLANAEQLAKTTSKIGGIKQPSLTEFTFLKRISGGAYARVFLATKTNTKDIYAVKVIKRKDAEMKNQVQRIFMERDILRECLSPFIVSFYYSILGQHNLYLFMEYLPGGDLYSLLEDIGSLDEESAKIYCKQIAQALGFLHKHGIIHRDLKPDNILISADGKLKLTDFGLSYFGVVGRTVQSEDKIVGTPDYVAPEVVMCLPHDEMCDYWSLGCIVYELVSGIPPFHRDSEQQTFNAILRGIYDPIEDVSPELNDFISKLLCMDPNQRLGIHGIDEILNHPWLQHTENETPFIPKLSSPLDTMYFQTRYQFTAQDEKDIISDVEEAQKELNKSRHHRAPSNASRGSLDSFTTVSVERLGLANKEAAKQFQVSRSSSGQFSDGDFIQTNKKPGQFLKLMTTTNRPSTTMATQKTRRVPKIQSRSAGIHANDDFNLRYKPSK